MIYTFGPFPTSHDLCGLLSLLMFRVHSVFFHDKIYSEVQSNICSRQKHRQSSQDQIYRWVKSYLILFLLDDVKKMRAHARDVENPNVRLLSDTLRNMLEENGDESRAMVFVKQRATCKRLAEFLDEDLADIKVRPLYGKENTEDEEGTRIIWALLRESLSLYL